MKKFYVVEVNPALDYLTEVIRELRWKTDVKNCRDEFLAQVYAQRRYKYVTGNDAWTFRFDLNGNRHHRGTAFSFKQNVLWTNEESVRLLPLDELTAESLLDAIRQLALMEVMAS